MLQVATFNLPGEVKEANEFLKTHKPEGNLCFTEEMLVVFYDDGEYGAIYKIAELRDLLRSVYAATMQQKIAMNTIERERAELNMVKNRAKYDELSNALQNCKKAIVLQESKRDFLLAQIEELQKTIE